MGIYDDSLIDSLAVMTAAGHEAGGRIVAQLAHAGTFALDVPLILVGGIRSPEVAERLLADGTADYFSMSRPLIREPDLVNRGQSGDRSPARCLSDNLCFRPGMTGKGIYRVTEERTAAPQE